MRWPLVREDGPRRGVYHSTVRWAIALLTLVVAPPAAARSQTPDSTSARWPSTPPLSPNYREDFGLGVATSLLAHELAHIGASYAVGKRPTFGFDRGRPTIYSGIDSHLEPHKQFWFSSAGLNVQALINEAILD